MKSRKTDMLPLIVSERPNARKPHLCEVCGETDPRRFMPSRKTTCAVCEGRMRDPLLAAEKIHRPPPAPKCVICGQVITGSYRMDASHGGKPRHERNCG